MNGHDMPTTTKDTPLIAPVVATVVAVLIDNSKRKQVLNSVMTS